MAAKVLKDDDLSDMIATVMSGYTVRIPDDSVRNELHQELFSVLRGPQAPPIEDRVRVTRVYVFEGPRKAMEDQIRRSLKDGTHQHGNNPVIMHVATIGNFPEILPPISAELLLMGSKKIYAGLEEDLVTRYDAAMAAGATHLTVCPRFQKDSNFLVYSLEEYRKTYSYMWPSTAVAQAADAAREITDAELDPRD